MAVASPLTLETTHDVLGWPAPTSVTEPNGPGASIFATLVREKIGRTLRRLPDASDARTGVLMADPNGQTSEPPVAIIAEFHAEVAPDTLRELHRLAWNFSHSPTVITIEPELLRVWSCCEAPNPDRPIEKYLVETLPAEHLQHPRAADLQLRAARALHWVNLVSGHFFAGHPERFKRDGRADQILLGNLRHIREELARQGLNDDDICHDLLARVIFVQFLFDRKDHNGNPALTESVLHRLQRVGLLNKRHASLDSVLADYDDTYRLFDWLNAKFNGDLFPGKGDTPEERALGWAKEKATVHPRHLSLLAGFIRGDVDMPAKQALLWPQYAFDVIPLEFISSIYETFVSDRAAEEGIFYTPSYLVDFILDRALPWGGTDWDQRILDPACGSGIFLVKSFQRLVHRWRQANPGKQVRAETLRRLLERNLFGVDKDPHAVRVACFSLYLAMCDEIEPRFYWTQVTFPAMRGRRLVPSDFFSEDRDGFRTREDALSYDLVVGNAPFGADVITDTACLWAESDGRQWTVPNNDIGGLFLAKSAELASQKATVALIQSANTILFNIGSAASFREELFTRHTVTEVHNLSALRFDVFSRKKHTANKPVAPICVVVLHRGEPPRTQTIAYVCPKRLRTKVDDFSIVIEPHDRRSLTVRDVLADPSIWSKLMWGKPRDLQLIDKLTRFPNLDNLPDDEAVDSRQGVNFGDGTRPAPEYEGKRMFKPELAGTREPWLFHESDLPVVTNVRVHSRESTSVQAFSHPQLIVKHSWTRATGRFRAWLSVSENGTGALCNQSFVSIHAAAQVLEAATLSHNSRVAVYYHFLTSGRFAAYRPKLAKREILGMPIPHLAPGMLHGLSTFEELDRKAYDLFHLTDAERVLIEDTLDYTLPDFLATADSRGTEPTAATDRLAEEETHLRAYCTYFLRVLRAGFGTDRPVSATIFRCPTGPMPYRLIAVTLGAEAVDDIEVKNVSSSALLRQLDRIGRNSSGRNTGSLGHHFVRIYEVADGLPAIFLLKPDQKRLWTRSMGLHDADAVALDLFMWQGADRETSEIAH